MKTRTRYINKLEELGALDEARTLTRAGKRIAALSVEPRFGRMLLAADSSSQVQRMR